MPDGLLLSIRFQDGRYHGTGFWPPEPARLFQALVAGAAQGGSLSAEDRRALGWLETLPAPLIAAPKARPGQGFQSFVPNNDIDAVGGDPRRIAELRVGKQIRPLLFDPAKPLLYLWSLDSDGPAEQICAISARLYQLGRGVDMAWALAEILPEAAIETRLAAHSGVIYRPDREAGTGLRLRCPQPGSLDSLINLFAAKRQQFRREGSGKRAGIIFARPPKPLFIPVSYSSPPHRLLYELRRAREDMQFAAWPLSGATPLITRIRDAAAQRLTKALGDDQAVMIDRVLVGRNADAADKATRIRLLPLPSIGSAHTDPSIRRILVEIPADCPIAAEDLAWGFSGLDPFADPKPGEIPANDPPVLIPTQNTGMLRHYGIDSGPAASVWSTITPAALPVTASRRRIDPDKQADPTSWKPAQERLGEEGRAATAILVALRHVGIQTPVETIRVQREPFFHRGVRAEAFAPGSRFAKEQLWHVEIRFAQAIRGPLVIGDGRYLGLGLMAPNRAAFLDMVSFALPAQPRLAAKDRADFMNAVRRALMALARDEHHRIPRLISGHEPDGRPAASGKHEHIFLAATEADAHLDRLILAAPWRCDHATEAKAGDAEWFEDVASMLHQIRAGRLGVIMLDPPIPVLAGDALIGPACDWISQSPYRPTRHARSGQDPAPALIQDIIRECERRRLPRPDVEILEITTGAKGGISALLRLRFAIAVQGPILLGRESHAGGGMFVVSGE